MVDLTKKDLENCNRAIEGYCRFIAGSYKDYNTAKEIRSSWKKVNTLVENNLREGFLDGI